MTKMLEKIQNIVTTDSLYRDFCDFTFLKNWKDTIRYCVSRNNNFVTNINTVLILFSFSPFNTYTTRSYQSVTCAVWYNRKKYYWITQQVGDNINDKHCLFLILVHKTNSPTNFKTMNIISTHNKFQMNNQLIISYHT